MRFFFAVSDYGVSRHPKLHRPLLCRRPPLFHVSDLTADRFDVVAVHDISVALLGDHRLGRFAFAAGVDRRTGRGDRLGLANRVLKLVALAMVRKARLGPQSVDHLQPFTGARIAVVVSVERQPVLSRLVRPPTRHYVERQPAMGDIVNVRSLLSEQGRLVEIGPYRYHQLDAVGHRRQGRRGRPGVERRLINALYVVDVEFGNQRQVPAGLLAALGQPPDIVPACRHTLVFDIAQPAAKHRHPITEPHQAFLSSISVRR